MRAVAPLIMHQLLALDFSWEPMDSKNPGIIMGSSRMDWTAACSLIGAGIRKGHHKYSCA